ncbi:fibronectin type III domain-containing protein [Dactylosporangium sp. CS-047395]|uniref:fibronectin type III domain-containing protein n=1 Tax=Dactylosporangium sp. CS-047395 TaxID=3239936 RepID=UPI003D8ADB86
MRTPLRQRLARAVALCTVAASAVLVFAPHTASAFTPVPAGPPARPAPPASPSPSLTDHPLTAAPSPLDNPLKGFARFYFPGDNQNSGYPRSLAWSYFGLSEVMTSATDCGTYNWSIVDNALNEIASYGNQAAIRFYMEYPGGTGSHPGNAIPHCFDGHVTYRNNTFWGTVSPDYDSAYLLSAVTNFIAAFGARYDGDPRIGFINLGIVGLWGEWHTWPFDTDTADGYPNLMPTDAHAAQIVAAFDNAFNTTKLEIRYPDSAGGAANARDIGYHDDSFCYKEGSPLKGVTLPQSLGGADYAQLQRALNMGVENKWVTDSMGGEVRPEIQSSAFTSWPGGSGQVDNMKACIELEHTTWKINQTSQSYASDDPNVAAAVRLMGYDLSATHAYYSNSVTGSANIGVSLTNNGVAPFYYPWTVQLGLKNSAGTVVKTWDTPWDLRTVQPLKVRAFPDWNVGADPTYRDFGYPQYFQSNVSLTGVANGSYQLVLKVRNPLEALSPAAKKLRFGNATQNADGWLGLGSIGVGGGTADTTAPSTPTGLTSPSKTATSVSLSWNASTDNVGVAGYKVLRGGTQVGTATGTSYTDTGLTASTAYSYTVQAYDAAGNTSASSSALSVTTSAGSSDTSPPTVPNGLTSPSKTSSSVSLSWNAATDNVGVAGYKVMRGGTQVGTATGTSYTDTGLTASTAYTYTVRAYDAAGNTSADSSSITVTTSGSSTPTGLVLDDYNGTPAYPSSNLNDLGKWTGGNCFLNGGGSGAVTGGALVLQYNNCGWFGSDVNQDVSAYTYLVVRIKGNAGGEQAHFNLSLGGTTKVFGDFVLDGGGHPSVTTAYQDIKIPMAANGISRTSPAQLAMGFWYGGNSTISIDSFSFSN